MHYNSCMMIHKYTNLQNRIDSHHIQHTKEVGIHKSSNYICYYSFTVYYERQWTAMKWKDAAWSLQTNQAKARSQRNQRTTISSVHQDRMSQTFGYSHSNMTKSFFNYLWQTQASQSLPVMLGNYQSPQTLNQTLH